MNQILTESESFRENKTDFDDSDVGDLRVSDDLLMLVNQIRCFDGLTKMAKTVTNGFYKLK